MFIQNNFQLLLTSMGMIESVDEEFSELKNNKHPQNTIRISATDFQSNIELRNIEFAFSGSSSFKLNINDLQIEPNKVLAFVGPSGGGKSTLVDLILGVHTSQKGQILFNQKPINQVDLNSLRKYIGYVSQDVTLFDDSIINNITLFQLNPDLEKVKQACVQANVWSFIESLELGLETQIGEKGIRISGGQRQRLSIARELFKCPKLLILDEATSALDVESELVVQEAIENLRGSITVIVIAHRLVTIKSAEIIAVLEEGMLIEKGTYSDLSENVNSRFYTMLNAQKI
jgi:subfamily B ATP-binding cassette protein MsbA